MQLTKIISTEIDSLTRRVIKFLRYGLKDTRTAEQIGPYGVDSNPIKDMVAVYTLTGTKGEAVIIGYINKNAIADVGENRIFSTDANGEVKATIHLKNTGVTQMTGTSWEIGGDAKNLVKFQELETAFNSLKQSHNDLVSAFNAHMHPTAGTGAPSPPTPGAGIPAQPATANISGAKIDNIKTA
jgi:hypothetical protein